MLKSIDRRIFMAPDIPVKGVRRQTEALFELILILNSQPISRTMSNISHHDQHNKNRKASAFKVVKLLKRLLVLDLQFFFVLMIEMCGKSFFYEYADIKCNLRSYSKYWKHSILHQSPAIVFVTFQAYCLLNVS